jgi:hypothetical protein
MIKEMETHCEDVIFTTQTVLNMTPESFVTLCSSTDVSTLGSGDTDLIDEK